MRYLMLLRHASGEGPQESTPEFDAEMKRWGELNREMRDAGVWVGATGLYADAVTTVRAPDGDPVVTDGDFELLLPEHPAVWAFLRRTPAAELLVGGVPARLLRRLTASRADGSLRLFGKDTQAAPGRGPNRVLPGSAPGLPDNARPGHHRPRALRSFRSGMAPSSRRRCCRCPM